MWCCLKLTVSTTGLALEQKETSSILQVLSAMSMVTSNVSNPAKGTDASRMYGDSWAKRMETITEGFDDKHEEMTARFRGKGTSLDDL